LRGKGGVFDVRLGGRLLFSKHQAGRFPDPKEIAAALEAEGVAPA